MTERAGPRNAWTSLMTSDGTAAAPSGEGLHLEGLTKVLGTSTVVDGLSLTVPAGQMCCLLGPSGCGKTTTLRMIGGFILPEQGAVRVNGLDVTALPPEKRPTAMVFQSYALWPHMSVFKNVAFGLRLRRLPRAEVEARVDAALSLVNLGHLRERRPAQLSGGEQQRVALARALVLEPQVLLLDEPLSNLDAKLRVAVREEIRDIQQRLGITTVFVTHDQDEALSVADQVAVMWQGRIEQTGSADAVYRLPRTTFVAGFVGQVSTLRGSLGPHGVRLGRGGQLVPFTGGALAVPAHLQAGEWDVAVRPEDVEVVEDQGDLGAGATARVVRETRRGHFKEVLLQLGAPEDRQGPGSGDLVRLRAYVPARPGPGGGSARVSLRRVLLDRDGVLAHEIGDRAAVVRTGGSYEQRTGRL